jgi:hypothetical protein
LADHDHVVLAPQQISNTTANQLVIVEQEDSYHHTMVPDQARHRKEAGSACPYRFKAAAAAADCSTILTRELRPHGPVCTLMVPAAIPFAVAAAFFPPAVAVMLWLFASPPRVRRGAVYLSGAATSTLASGAIILSLLHGVATAPGRRTVIESAVQVVLGGLFVVFAVGLALRRPALRGLGWIPTKLPSM